MNGRNALLDVLKEAKAKAVDLHQRTKEAYSQAGVHEQRARIKNTEGRDLEIDAACASKRVGELEAEIAATPARAPQGVLIEPVAARDHRALIEDAKVGPWFICMQLDGQWTFLQIVTLWSDVERFSVSVAENNNGCGKVVALPVRWLEVVPEMMLQLFECQQLLWETADVVTRNGLMDVFKNRACEAQKVLRAAHAPQGEE